MTEGKLYIDPVMQELNAWPWDVRCGALARIVMELAEARPVRTDHLGQPVSAGLWISDSMVIQANGNFLYVTHVGATDTDGGAHPDTLEANYQLYAKVAKAFRPFGNPDELLYQQGTFQRLRLRTPRERDEALRAFYRSVIGNSGPFGDE